MKKLFIFFVFLLLFFPGVALAQTPTPAPTPMPHPDSPLFGEDGTGLPQPFPIPEPDPENRIDPSPLWDYASLADSISAFLTIWVLADKNMLIQVSLVAGVIALVIIWVARMLGRRSDESV